jgi:hypothetical protein
MFKHTEIRLLATQEPLNGLSSSVILGSFAKKMLMLSEPD